MIFIKWPKVPINDLDIIHVGESEFLQGTWSN